MALQNYQPIAHLLGAQGPIHALTYSSSPGSYILTGSADRSIRLYNPANTEPAGHPTLYHAPLHQGSSSSSSSSVHEKPTARSIPQAQPIFTYTRHGYEVLAIDVTQDNEKFASCGGDRYVFLWDVATGTVTHRFGGTPGVDSAPSSSLSSSSSSSSSTGGHTSRINTVKFSGAGGASVLVSGGFDTTVRVWDARAAMSNTHAVSTLRPLSVWREARDAVTSLAVHDAEVIVGSVDGRVRSYDVRMGRVTTDVVAPGHGVTHVDASRDGKTCLVASLDDGIRLFDRKDGSCLRSYPTDSNQADCGQPGHHQTKTNPHHHPPGRRNRELRMQTCFGGNEAWILAGDERPAETNGLVDTQDTPEDSVAAPNASLSSSPSSSSPSDDARLWAWDVLSGRVVAQFAVPWGPVDRVEQQRRQRRAVDRMGREKPHAASVLTCVAWQDRGWGRQFCVGGNSGVVTVFG